MFNRKIMLTIILLCCVLVAATGCTDHKQLKQDLLQAVRQQEQIQAYRFSGHAELKLDAALFAGTPPLTAAVLSVLRESAIDYSGAVSLTEPARMESTFKVTPKGASVPFEIPVLLKDNKLYVRLPVVNKPDEYLQLPLGDKAGGLKNTGYLGSVIGSKLLQGIDPDWLDPGEQAQQDASGTPSAKGIVLNITSKNEKEAAAYLHDALPILLDELMTSGLSTEAQNGQWKKSADRLKVTAPSSLDVTIDPKGYIRRQSGKLHFQWDGGASNEIVWNHASQEADGTIAFTMEEPKQVKQVSDLLRWMPKPPK